MKLTAKVTGTERISDVSTLKIEEESLNGMKFSDQTLTQFISLGSRFENCDFRNMNIAQACFGSGKSDSYYINCVFDGSKIRASTPGFARFEKCSFANVVFSELNCIDVEFIDCIFSGKIKKGFFNGAASEEATTWIGRKANDFFGNDFKNSQLGDIGFRTGIDLTKQLLPSGEEYIYISNIATAIDMARKANPSFSTQDQAALSALIKMLERDLASGQRQAFFNIEVFPANFRPAFDAIRSH